MKHSAARVLVLIFAFAIVLPSGVVNAGCEMLEYHRVQATPHVYLFEAAEGTTGIVNGNIVAVIGKEAILLVDAGQFPSASRKVLGELRSLSQAPVRYIVNTHWHGDHLLADSVFKDAFPKAEIIAHSHTISEANRHYKDYVENSLKQFPLLMADMRKRMDASSSVDERLWMKETLDCAELAIPEIKITRYLPADRPMDSKLEINLGDLPVVIEHLGTGNTPGDLVVFVEADKLVATGDMIVFPSPYAIGSDLEPWPATLERLMHLGAEVYVPGHGPVLRDTAYIRDVEDLLKTTRTQLSVLYDQGVAKMEAAQQLDTSSFRAKYINTPMRRQAFDQFFVKAAVSAMDSTKKPSKVP